MAVDLHNSFDKFVRAARNEIWDTDILDWVAMTQDVGPGGAALTDAELRAADVKVSLDGEAVVVNPIDDIDVTIGYTGDKPNSIVLTRGAQTKTMTIGWSGENMTSITSTIT